MRSYRKKNLGSKKQRTGLDDLYPDGNLFLEGYGEKTGDKEGANKGENRRGKGMKNKGEQERKTNEKEGEQ